MGERETAPTATVLVPQWPVHAGQKWAQTYLKGARRTKKKGSEVVLHTPLKGGGAVVWEKRGRPVPAVLPIRLQQLHCCRPVHSCSSRRPPPPGGAGLCMHVQCVC